MVVAALGTVLAAGYLLWLYQRVAFGVPSEEFAHDPHLHDVTVPEWIAWLPMLVGIVVLGFFPNLIFKVTDPAVTGSVVSGAVAGRELITPCPSCSTAPPGRPPRSTTTRSRPRSSSTGVIVLMILVDLFAGRDAKGALSSLAGIGLLGAAIPIITLAVNGADRSMFGGAYVVDHFALVLEGAVPASPATWWCCCPPTTSPRATTGRASTTSSS